MNKDQQDSFSGSYLQIIGGASAHLQILRLRLLCGIGADNHLKKTADLCKKIAKRFVKPAVDTLNGYANMGAVSREWIGLLQEVLRAASLIR
jgi:hypothetical protein